jgi:hypothetical protein
VTRAFAVLAVVVLVAGCGGKARLTRHEFARQADAICAKYNKKLRGLPQPRTLAQLNTFAAKAVPLVRQAAGELHALKPPNDEQRVADAWNKANGDVVTAMEHVRAAVKKTDRTAVTKALAEGNRANDHSNQLARALGMTTCAQ